VAYRMAPYLHCFTHFSYLKPFKITQVENIAYINQDLRANK